MWKPFKTCIQYENDLIFPIQEGILITIDNQTVINISNSKLVFYSTKSVHFWRPWLNKQLQQEYSIDNDSYLHSESLPWV